MQTFSERVKCWFGTKSDRFANDVLEYWFDHPHIWFNATDKDDKTIYNRFEKYIDLVDTFDTGCFKVQLATIIFYDQLTRHFARVDKEYVDSIPVYNELAREVAKPIIKDRNYLSIIFPQYIPFILLPFRHTNRLEDIQMTINLTRDLREKKDHSALVRFYKASINHMVRLKLEQNLDFFESKADPVKHLDILDNTHVDDSNVTTSLLYTFKSHFKGFDNVAVSLSGGVDSMVATFVLKQMEIPFVCAHIQYNNRATSQKEVEFLTWWCTELGVKLYIYDITEITSYRDNNFDKETPANALKRKDRNYYEEITKKIRFGFYRKFGCPVVLGHNHDDTVENIITNIRKKRNLDNLRGMERLAEIDGVQIFRPMLDIPKQQIYQLAQLYDIPHFADSTPTWSDRGRIRDVLKPVLEEFGLVNPLTDLSTQVTELYTLNQELVDQYIQKLVKEDVPRKELTPELRMSIARGPVTCIRLPLNTNLLKLPVTFWKPLLLHIAKELDCDPPTAKAVKTFVLTIQRYGVDPKFNKRRVQINSCFQAMVRIECTRYPSELVFY